MSVPCTTSSVSWMHSWYRAYRICCINYFILCLVIVIFHWTIKDNLYSYFIAREVRICRFAIYNYTVKHHGRWSFYQSSVAMIHFNERKNNLTLPGISWIISVRRTFGAFHVEIWDYSSKAAVKYRTIMAYRNILC